MFRLREEIDGAELGGVPAEAGEGGDVAGKGFGVTADIDNTLRAHFVYGGNTLRGAAGAGRVHEHHVRPVAVLGQLLHILPGVPGGEPAVLDAVEAGVGNGVLHRVPVYLHAYDLL